jgi:hypothetical protein
MNPSEAVHLHRSGRRRHLGTFFVAVAGSARTAVSGFAGQVFFLDTMTGQFAMSVCPCGLDHPHSRVALEIIP